MLMGSQFALLKLFVVLLVVGLLAFAAVACNGGGGGSGNGNEDGEGLSDLRHLSRGGSAVRRAAYLPPPAICSRTSAIVTTRPV